MKNIPSFGSSSSVFAAIHKNVLMREIYEFGQAKPWSRCKTQ
jgi:hypothetical protein